MPPEGYYDDFDSTFDKNMFDDYFSTNTLEQLESKYVVPKGTKTIEIVVEEEEIGDVTILYTESGKSYAKHQVDNIGVVFSYHTEGEE